MKTTPVKIAITLLVLSVGAALAHSGASGVVKKRMEMMGDIAVQMKSVAQMLNGQSDFNASHIAASAKRIAEHATQFEAMFPEGTVKSPSEARPEIWTNWDAFVDKTNAMKVSALALANAAKTAEGPLDIEKTFGQLGMSCKSCHQDFRQKR